MICLKITVGGSTGEYQERGTKGDNPKDLLNSDLTLDWKNRVMHSQEVLADLIHIETSNKKN